MPLYETQSRDESNETDVFGADWQAQIFKPSIAHTITLCKLRLYRVGSPGTVTVGVRAVAAGEPTGADLASGTIDGNTLGTATAGATVQVIFTTPISLTAATSYALVIRVPSGNISNALGLRIGGVSLPTNPYANGDIYRSADSGGTWTLGYAGDYDLWFEEWGMDVGSSLWIEADKLRYIDGTFLLERATKYEGEQETF